MPEVSSRVMALLPVGADRLAVASHRRICVWNHVTGERTAVLLGHQVRRCGWRRARRSSASAAIHPKRVPASSL